MQRSGLYMKYSCSNHRQHTHTRTPRWNYIVCIPGQQQSFVSKSISHGPLLVGARVPVTSAQAGKLTCLSPLLGISPCSWPACQVAFMLQPCCILQCMLCVSHISQHKIPASGQGSPNPLQLYCSAFISSPLPPQLLGMPVLVQVTNIDDRTIHVNGTPATCANLALHTLVPDVDFVISGPNIGHNVGRCAAKPSSQVNQYCTTAAYLYYGIGWHLGCACDRDERSWSSGSPQHGLLCYHAALQLPKHKLATSRPPLLPLPAQLQLQVWTGTVLALLLQAVVSAPSRKQACTARI